jgi:hypothetical protein
VWRAALPGAAGRRGRVRLAEPFAEAARRRALDAWTRIAEPADPDQALAALETALGHDAFNECLYQQIMRRLGRLPSERLVLGRVDQDQYAAGEAPDVCQR